MTLIREPIFCAKNYQLVAKRNNENILLANAKTGMVCYDYEVKKVAAIPEKLKSILER